MAGEGDRGRGGERMKKREKGNKGEETIGDERRGEERRGRGEEERGEKTITKLPG